MRFSSDLRASTLSRTWRRELASWIMLAPTFCRTIVTDFVLCSHRTRSRDANTQLNMKPLCGAKRWTTWENLSGDQNRFIRVWVTNTIFYFHETVEEHDVYIYCIITEDGGMSRAGNKSACAHLLNGFIPWMWRELQVRSSLPPTQQLQIIMHGAIFGLISVMHHNLSNILRK